MPDSGKTKITAARANETATIRQGRPGAAATPPQVLVPCLAAQRRSLIEHPRSNPSRFHHDPCSTRNLLRPKIKRTQACFGACIVIDYISIWCACLHAYRRNIRSEERRVGKDGR